MALFRSTARRGLMQFGNYDWHYVPKQFPDKNVMRPVGSRMTKLSDKAGMRLRGTGLHGPENEDVMKLVMWNRLKEKRPQRTYFPSPAEYREMFRWHNSFIWATYGVLVLFWPAMAYSNYYAKHHDHHIWAPPRTDGTRGHGPSAWWKQ
uniref:Uncharacterized protein n=1 Tax=Chromera velia CCMP2878 TaxID=1169474 RepID=A0A0G4HLR8_9ALVE|mmetsp:Transcript_17224/g.34934  ORF Transcript_17224/g.34934 Transcript_17224/m.34934 type:complete len:149 (-) Transcript_17224:772-1218(-)|eukprot:Cvel_28922.t1-p1 / transcript=Cvel_28922.t1 / gene=Cvel_28922 / organism=Chromera_velia_CCMP2878 / gene_product=hypothetical protein / transcript_product=hypothetical protein / location=Cvel_scaffold3870:4629-6794(-) / protein_length=148 / sequence_SO=supercontig / SO=protein_coding / is_pseudo=false